MASDNDEQPTGESSNNVNEALEKRLATVEQKLTMLVECVITPDAPATIKKKGLRVKTRDWKATAKRARMGRAAKRAGVSFKQWLSTHGETDKA